MVNGGEVHLLASASDVVRILWTGAILVLLTIVFSVALIVLVRWYRRRESGGGAFEVATLDELRREGLLSDEEFAKLRTRTLKAELEARTGEKAAGEAGDLDVLSDAPGRERRAAREEKKTPLGLTPGGEDDDSVSDAGPAGPQDEDK